MSGVVNAADIVGQVLTMVDEKETEHRDGLGQEVCDVTFYTFATARGRADVVLHCEHNGYYCGWLNDPVEVDELPEPKKEG